MGKKRRRRNRQKHRDSSIPIERPSQEPATYVEADMDEFDSLMKGYDAIQKSYCGGACNGALHKLRGGGLTIPASEEDLKDADAPRNFKVYMNSAELELVRNVQAQGGLNRLCVSKQGFYLMNGDGRPRIMKAWGSERVYLCSAIKGWEGDGDDGAMDGNTIDRLARGVERIKPPKGMKSLKPSKFGVLEMEILTKDQEPSYK